MVSYAETFREEVERFLSDTGMQPTAFGKEALKDPRFVFDIREGRSPSGNTMDKVLAWMAVRRLRSAAPAQKRKAATGKRRTGAA